MYTKNKNTISCPLCCRYNSTGEVCELYHYRYAGSCQLVGGVAEPPADDCLHLFDVDPGSCGSFRDEACQYRGQVLLEKTSVTDYHSCQGLLQGLGPIYGASYFVYDSSPAPTGHRCRLYSSWERSCSAVMGPRYPDIDECHENHPISSSSTTTTNNSFNNNKNCRAVQYYNPWPNNMVHSQHINNNNNNSKIINNHTRAYFRLPATRCGGQWGLGVPGGEPCILIPEL